MFDYLGAANAAANTMLGVANMYLTSQAKYDDRRFASEMYERQKADNLENWNRMNEYNSPSSQMRRFSDAGLNANLMFGQGTPGNASSAADTGQYKPVYGPVPQLDKLDILGKYFQVQNMKLQNQMLSEQIDESITRQNKNAAEKDYIKAMQPLRENIAAMQYDNMVVQHSNLQHMQTILGYYTVGEQDENDNYIKGSSYAEKDMIYRTAENFQRVQNLIASRRLTVAQVATELMKPNVMSAQITKLQADANLSNEQAKVVYMGAVGSFLQAVTSANKNVVQKHGTNPLNTFWNALDDLPGIGDNGYWNDIMNSLIQDIPQLLK